MQSRPSPLLWLALGLLVLMPTAAGRWLLDLLGGLMLLALAIPLVLSAVGWIGWKVLQSKMVTCNACGSRTFSNAGQCPICGSSLSEDDKTIDANRDSFSSQSSVPASSATIDISAEDVDSES